MGAVTSTCPDYHPKGRFIAGSTADAKLGYRLGNQDLGMTRLPSHYSLNDGHTPLCLLAAAALFFY
jgi:hypothetical protein